MPKIDEGVISFAVYENSTEFYGMAEVTLPEISNITAEIKGAGLNGTLNPAIIGHIEAMTMTLNFRTFQPEAVKLMKPEDHSIDLRAAQQVRDENGLRVQKVKYVLIMTPTKLNPGKLGPASTADASGEYAVSYYAAYIDGKKMFEIDIPNFKYEVDGKDYLADVRDALGK